MEENEIPAPAELLNDAGATPDSDAPAGDDSGCRCSIPARTSAIVFGVNGAALPLGLVLLLIRRA